MLAGELRVAERRRSVAEAEFVTERGTHSLISNLDSCSLLCFPSYTSSSASLPKLPGWKDSTGKL